MATDRERRRLDREARRREREEAGQAVEAPTGAAPRRRRSRAAGQLIRVVSMIGIVGIGVAIGAIMRSQGSTGWLIGLVISVVTLVLAAVVRFSHQRL